MLVLAVTLTMQFGGGTAQAIFGKQRLLYDDNILLFDWKDTPVAAACGDLGNDGPINLVGNDNVEKAFRYFVSRGLSTAQSAGIVGNLIAESGVDPNIVQPMVSPNGRPASATKVPGVGTSCRRRPASRPTSKLSPPARPVRGGR